MSVSWFGEYLFCELVVEIFKRRLQTVKPLHFNGSFELIRNKEFKS